MDVIFTITPYRSDRKDSPRKAIAWFPDFDTAFKEMKRCSREIYEEAYDWCVIEHFQVGFAQICMDPKWYKWDEELELYMESTKCPEGLQNVVNFGMG